MKVARLTKYGSLAASTRQRFEQYDPYLAAEGFAVESQPLLGDDYLRRLYAGKPPGAGYLASRYAARLRWLLTARDIDVFWIAYELFPYLPGFFERLAKFPGKPVILDFDDAVFHNYDLHRSRLVRALLRDKIGQALSVSVMSFCGNDYLADYARNFASDVFVVPTVLDTAAYLPASAAGRPPAVGWIGTPSTWNAYMLPMVPMLVDLAAAAGARIVVVGAGPDAPPHPLLDSLDWSEDTEVSRIQQMDIGVMPLADTPWARGKCGYKLIQYMACGLPVVASPVGVNARIVEHGVNGFLASTEAEWRQALDLLLRDADLRQRMGREGRRKVEAQYSLAAWGPRVAGLVADAAKKRR